MKKILLLSSLTLTSTLCAVELPMISIESSKLEDTLLESSYTVDLIDEKKLEISNVKEDLMKKRGSKS